MKNKLTSLTDMIKLSANPKLSESYIRYLCGIDNEKQYRHQEIKDIDALLSAGSTLSKSALTGFIYSYDVPQLNREFDLLKITKTCCLNIELKSADISKEKIKKQLIQNKHYLKLLNKKLFLFTYVSSSNTVYSLNDCGELIQVELSSFFDTWCKIEGSTDIIDLDEVFSPQNTLISPLNAPDRFLAGEYILTENQDNIKQDILSYINSGSVDRFVELSGGPGTGKTLLIYDLAKELSDSHKILLVHSGILCDGHYMLNSQLNNVKIVSAKELKEMEIEDVDLVIVDESHRLYPSSLDKIVKWGKQTKGACIFSYDLGQILSKSEERKNVVQTINEICENHAFKLKNRIRTNKELFLFITCLLDLSRYREEYSFPNAKIIFEPDKSNLKDTVKALQGEGYTYISYTPSIYWSDLDEQADEYNTHNVIGQEFDNVCMILDDNFYYDQSRKMCAVEHPNPDYIFTKLLYQGVTRVRNKIAIIVTSETLLKDILPLMKSN